MFLDTLKANILIIIFLGGIGFLGYWGVTSLQVNSEEFDTQRTDVRPVIENEPTGYLEETNSQVSETPANTTNTTSSSSNTTNTTSSGSYGDLENALQKLIDDNVLMKKGSKGTRVGTIQEFLNIYNGTDSKMDNDFGATTENQVKAFQKAEGLSADGQTGSGTYKKMIEWLKKQ